RIVLVPGKEVVVERVEAAEVDVSLQLRTSALVVPDVGLDLRLIDVAALERVPGGGVVDDDFEDDRLQVRLDRTPVIGTPLQTDLLTGNAAGQAIGSGADDHAVERRLEVLHVRVDVLGDDAQAVEPAELRREHFLEGDDDGVVVDDAGLLEVELVEPAGDLHR